MAALGFFVFSVLIYTLGAWFWPWYWLPICSVFFGFLSFREIGLWAWAFAVATIWVLAVIYFDQSGTILNRMTSLLQLKSPFMVHCIVFLYGLFSSISSAYFGYAMRSFYLGTRKSDYYTDPIK